ncbi:hypothetical protein E2542_SST14171 [Spatholobus suberectus]|nr:hypothetical protein E2542_SST14171 [Spatholobus suberectus]
MPTPSTHRKVSSCSLPNRTAPSSAAQLRRTPKGFEAHLRQLRIVTEAVRTMTGSVWCGGEVSMARKKIHDGGVESRIASERENVDAKCAATRETCLRANYLLSSFLFFLYDLVILVPL